MKDSNHKQGRRTAAKAIAAGAAWAALPTFARAQEWKPTQEVKYIIPAGPGGSLDQAVRMIKSIAEKRQLIDQNIIVENRPGGAGKIALSHLDRNEGNPHYLSVITYSLLSNHILGKLGATYSDYATIAMLFNEYTTISVRADSPIKDARDLVSILKKDPSSRTLAIATSLGNHIHVGAAKPLHAAGVDISGLNIVPFKSSAESLTNLIGGHIEVMAATTPNVISQLKAGNIRVIAIASKERLAGDLAGVPTWKESGVDSSYESAQGVMAPKGIPAAAMAYWANFFETVSKDPEWEKFVASRQWELAFQATDDARQRLASAYEQTKGVLSNLGLVKS